jgi:Mn2+/Fe2+ NRAMP family transporter
VLTGSIALGVAIAFSGISPIRLLFVSSIIAGLGTPVSLVYLLAVAGDGDLMAGKPISLPMKLLGWVVTLAVSAASVAFVVLHL